MPNDVFRAVDATLVLGVEDASLPEGTAADALISEYDLTNTVGRLQRVTVSVLNDVQPFYQIGRRYPTHLRPGVVQVSGRAERAYVNAALLRLLLGEGAVSPPGAANFVQPSFNIVASLQDPAHPDQMARVTIFGTKFDAWDYQLATEDNFVMERVSFQALRIAFEEQ
jgi:hypothetical protein